MNATKMGDVWAAGQLYNYVSELVGTDGDVERQVTFYDDNGTFIGCVIEAKSTKSIVADFVDDMENVGDIEDIDFEYNDPRN